MSRSALRCSSEARARLWCSLLPLAEVREDFDDLAEKLASAGYMTAAIDPRGFGKSTGPAGRTMADFAVDVAEVVEALSPGKPAVLIGHAFGNRVARSTAAFAPQAVSGLILLACGGQ